MLSCSWVSFFLINENPLKIAVFEFYFKIKQFSAFYNENSELLSKIRKTCLNKTGFIIRLKAIRGKKGVLICAMDINYNVLVIKAEGL
jgi:hypothetical protein